MNDFNCKTLDDFFQEYSVEIAASAEATLKALHVPGRDGTSLCAKDLTRKPYEPQAHVVCAAVKAWNDGKGISLVAEMGTGKTIMAIGAAHSHASQPAPARWTKKNGDARGRKVANWQPRYRAIVMCPPQLVKKWAREIKATVRGAKVTVVAGVEDLVGIDWKKRAAGPHWFVIGRERAKLGCGWRPAATRRSTRKGWKVEGAMERDERVWRCPRCHQIQVDKDGEVRDSKWLMGKSGKGETRRHCSAPRRHLAALRNENPRACGEQLWNDGPWPRRASPSRYIKARCRFDYFVLDEAHEEKSAESIQAQAVSDIAGVSKKVMALTGTLVGGYAWHVRTLQYRIGAAQSLVRMGFGWKDETAFNEKYGRMERKITEKEKEVGKGHRNAKGGTSTKTEKYVRPGIMPTLFGEHLVNRCIFLSLDEMAANLPSYEEEVVPVPLSGPLVDAYQEVEDDLMSAIKDMLQKGNKKLLGTMLQVLLCYPDFPFQWGQIGYWDGDGAGREWRTVCLPRNLPEDAEYAKETALVDYVKEEVRQRRQVWVYAVFTDKRDCVARLEARLTRAGVKVAVLRSKVDPTKREEWIAKHGPNVDVVISHPELVKTGLDFFDMKKTFNFQTLIFYQTGYSLFTLMQAARRSWRLGQFLPCRTVYFYYQGTMQERAMTLMGQKAAAANAISGRFSTEGLAAMAGDAETVETELARGIAERTAVDAVRAWAKLSNGKAGQAKMFDANKFMAGVRKQMAGIDPQLAAKLAGIKATIAKAKAVAG